MKKYLIIFIALLLTILMTFAGCSDSSDSAGSDNDNEGDNTANAIEDLADLFSKSDDYTEEGISYTQTMTMGDMTTTIKTWMKSDFYKTSASMEGQEIVSIINYETEESIVYYPEQNMGTVFSLTEGEADSNYFDINEFQEGIDTTGFENLGRETINGEECYVVETMDMVTSSSAKMWISEKYGIIMKMEALDESTGEGYTYELEDIKIGVDDSEFEVPSDIILQSFKM
ncbi:MAG TPA: hypothetical protein VJ916_02130 [Anaerovoracaceae bacterium]|nr:hypothetical protein [Anaerovoracaceae bacterium]